MTHRFSKWKYYCLAMALLIALIYAIPNLYGEDPAVQVTGLKSQIIHNELEDKIKVLLQQAHLEPKSVTVQNDKTLLIRFTHPEVQLKAQELIRQSVNQHFSVALNLAPATPHWLTAIGAKPMKLGLDLRGGVHFLMEVDMNAVLARRIEGYFSEMPKILREGHIYYKTLTMVDAETFKITFGNREDQNKAYAFLQKREGELILTRKEEPESWALIVRLSPLVLREIRHETMEQTLATLRNRVNELGVAEALVQRQGLDRVIVELPGIQDTAYARDILGKTATLHFLMEDYEHSIKDMVSGQPVFGSKMYFDKYQRPVLLKTQPILTGEAITSASTGQDRDGRPAVSVRLGGDTTLFSKVTRENIGRRMAAIYVEVKNGETTETPISLATIQSGLGNHFQITGLTYEEARDLALLLRAGALPAPISIVEESIVGPSIGQENIHMGIISVIVGLVLVLAFMAMYYSVFGMIANLALMANLILLVASLSLIGATLTLPGIAGIVLTLGMAVDANVLIFERIREELRLGVSPKASIVRGYEYAFATILDSNLTTLIVGVVLFAIGTGPVKGFAVTLCIGILTSLVTATAGSRAIIELLYGGRSQKQIRIGI